MAKEGSESELILGLVVGIAGLVISVIIAFIIVSTIADVERDTATLLTGYVVTNESSNVAGINASLNDTEYTLGKAGLTGFTSPVITKIYNVSGGVSEVNVGNASVTDAGVLTNGTTLSYGWDQIWVSYTYGMKGTTLSTTNLRTNFTSGIDKVSSKIPTVLLIAAVVLILGILALLWFQYQKMDIGGGGGQL